ncbi:MAG: MarR family transcriptional regulator [Pseudomonadota bacterium]
MTEMAETLEIMPDAVRSFVLHWGDMGQQWGVNRSIAQIHALLYISERALPAETISEVLGIARSNVSTSLKELIGFDIVRRVPVAGDRRDYFAAETDVWELARRIAAVRKAREIDPALRTLSHCLSDAEGDPRVTDEQRRRLREMHAFTADMDRWYGQMQSLPVKTLTRLVRLGDRIVALLGLSRT